MEANIPELDTRDLGGLYEPSPADLALFRPTCCSQRPSEHAVSSPHVTDEETEARPAAPRPARRCHSGAGPTAGAANGPSRRGPERGHGAGPDA